MNIPQRHRKTILCNLLTPKFIFPYNQVPEKSLGILIEIRDLKLETKSGLAHQAKILLDNTDPKIRVVPQLKGMNTDQAGFSYALAQENFTIVNLLKKRLDRSTHETTLKEVADLCKILVHTQKQKGLFD